MFDNAVALSGCIVPTGSLSRGQIVALLWTPADEQLTWLNASERAFFQVIDVALDQSYVIIQRYCAEPGATDQYISTDTSFLVPRVVSRVFVLSESELRHLPSPNHVLELIIPPIPGLSAAAALMPSMPSGSPFGAFGAPYDARGRKTDETSAIHHRCNGDLNKVEELLGYHSEK